jgi:hypothetical protein
MGEDCLDQVSRGVENVLAVVEHQQPRAALQSGRHTVSHTHARLLGDPEHRGHRLGHRARIADRGQFDHPHPIGEGVGTTSGDLEGQPCLADPARTGQRDKLMGPQYRLYLAECRLAPDEAGAR